MTQSKDTIKADIGILSLIRLMWPFLKKFKGLLLLNLSLILVMAGLGRFLPIVFGWAIDQGIGNKDLAKTLEFASLYLGIYVAYGLILFVYDFLFQKLGNQVLYAVRSELISHTQKLPFDYFNKNPDGRIITRLTSDVASLQELFNGGLIMAFAQLILLISIVIAMLLISVKLTLMVLFLTPIFLFVAAKLSMSLKIVLRKSKAKLSEINSFTAENLNGIQIVQLYNRIALNHDRYRRLTEQYRDISLQTVKRYAMLWPTINFYSALTIVIALYFGADLFSSGQVAIGAMVAFFMHVQDLQNPLRDIIERYQQIQNSMTSAERVFAMLEEPIEQDLDTGYRPEKVIGQLKFEDLMFRYDESQPWVLKKLNLQIAAGETIGIVGKTGSGKTTLISLLQRLYDYQSGDILLDGVSLKKYAKRSLRGRIGVVQQDTTTFRGSFFDNISLNNPSLKMERVLEACKKVGLDRTLQRFANTNNSNLDHGIFGLIEERGANLSVGEKQLIAFARILAFDKDILILDEATANIDSETEKLIQLATSEVTKGRTSLIIAHRLSTLEKCDRILVLDQGQVAEIGTHQELYDAKGTYYSYLQQSLETI